jgi:ligand-binding sensor domain-containing protein
MKNPIKKPGPLSILLLFACLTLSTHAQGANYKVNDTILGDKIITALAESEEYRWVGTTNGLIRISRKTGKQKIYTRENSNLPGGFITSLCCRKNGHVWIGTMNGIVVNDGYYFFWMNVENTDIPDNQVFFIVEDKDQVVWVGTHSGLLKVRNNKFKQFDINVKEVITEKNGGNLFITTSNENIHSLSLK